MSLKFIKLHIGSVKVVVLLDALLANTPGLKSRLGVDLLMVDDQYHANIVHYGSSTCHSLSGSVMFAKVHALVLVLDHAYMVRKTLEELLGRQKTLKAFVNSQALFNVIAKYSETA